MRDNFLVGAAIGGLVVYLLIRNGVLRLNGGTRAADSGGGGGGVAMGDGLTSCGGGLCTTNARY